MTQRASRHRLRRAAARLSAGCADFARLLWRRWYVVLPLVALYGWALAHLRVNLSHSLPYTLVYVEDWRGKLRRGDLVVYRLAGDPGSLAGARFFKRVRGVPGDRVEVVERAVRVNGEVVGIAKRRRWDGMALEVIEPGVIPPGRFYVQGDGPDSFDSRYRDTGLVPAGAIVARAHVLF